MKRILIILTLVFLVSLSQSEAATVKVDKNTELHPQGWIAGNMLFKTGTDVTLNDKGEVISGTLKNYTFLKPAARAYYRNQSQDLQDIICLKADTVVTFNERGEVASGTLGDDANLMIVKNTLPYVTFKSSTPIVFNMDGSVASGTIKSDMYLRPVGWENNSKENAGFISYKAGTELAFNNKGEVVASKSKETISE